MIRKEPRIFVNEQGEKEATLAHSEKLEDELCDFCALLKPPYKVYPCRDFPHPMSPRHWSRGDWNACGKCAELIDADKREELLERCLLIYSYERGQAPPEADMITKAFHDEFFKNRIKEEAKQ